MKTSKVQSVQTNGTWDSPNGIFYKFEYQMEDGQIVNAMHKTVDGNFKVGEEVEYEITNANYNSGKVKKPMQQFGAPKQDLKGVKIGHAITNAVALVCSQGHGDLTLPEAIKAYAKMIYSISEELNNEL